MLEIKDLHASAGGAKILKGISLTVRPGEVHAIMGPNGSGKSTVANVLAGRPSVEVTGGSIRFEGEDLLALSPEERARKGIFLAFQYPVEIPGIANSYFLKAALNAIRVGRGEDELDAFDFLAIVREKMRLVEMDEKFMSRSVNEGFSGGEKKRNEILQMAVLEPKLAILDETDSGLDIDALRTVAAGVNALRSPQRSMIVITHYQRLLDYVVPDAVHVLADGCIVRSGGAELALELESRGYGWLGAGGTGSCAVTALATERDRLVAGFGAHAGALAKGSPDWLPPLRAAAMQQFAELGFPSRKREDWKYTNVAPIARALAETAFEAVAVARDEIAAVVSQLPNSLVFVNGRLAPEFSKLHALPEGALVRGLAQALTECPDLVAPHWKADIRASGRALVALNTALQRDGAFVWLSPRVRIEEPIQLLFITSGTAPEATSHPRNLIVLAEGAEASVVERHISLSNSTAVANAVSEIFLAADSRLDHLVLEIAGESATHLESCFARLQANARLRSHVISLGAALSRNELEVVLEGPGAECDLYGLYSAAGDRHVDNQTLIDHAAPHCSSRELYKGVLDGRSRGIFNGKIIVRADAQKTQAVQSNPNLILSDGAEVDSRPNLEIHADDVKCSHGATIGRLDEDALFFLRARGIGASEAQRMLCHAFGAEVIDAIASAPLRDEIRQRVARVIGAASVPA